MGRTIQILAGGAVTMGIITALFLPGRQTVQGIKAGGQAVQGIFGTVIKG